MYFLDANALYWYIGVDKLGFKDQSGVDEEKLRAFLDMQQGLCIPSSVYMEVITHFRWQPDKLKLILDFFEEKHLRVVNNLGGYVCTSSELSAATQMSISELQKYANNMLQKKMAIEVGFIQLFADVVSLLYLEYVLRINNINEEDGKNSLLQYLGREHLIADKEKDKATFMQALSDGYQNNTELKTIQEVYIQYLEEQCLVEKSFVDTWIAFQAGEEDLVTALQKSARKLSKKLNKDNGVMKTIHSTLSTDQKFLKEAKEKIASMLVSHHYSECQAAYLREVMFSKWFDSAQKFLKNDIFDMLCLGALDIKDPIPAKTVLEDKTSYLITFDQTMRSFIKTIRPYNDTIIQRFVIN